jgi:hypothetical protein
MKRRRSLYARPENRPRTAVRRGAASCRAVLRSCSVAAVVRGVLAGVVTAELSGVAERHRCGNPSGIWASQPAVAVAVAVGAVRTPDTPLVALSASAVRRADVRPLVGRTSGVHATGVHATGAIRKSGWTRVRCPRPLRPRCPHRAGSWNTSVRRGSSRLGASGATCRWVRERLGLRCRIWAWRGRMVVRWQCVARTRVGGRPGPPQRMRTGCGAVLATWPTRE